MRPIQRCERSFCVINSLQTLKQDTTALRPGIVLVADPDLRDPNFERTLILLVSHDEDGSFGFVINRATNQRLADVSDPEELQGLEEVPVFLGGPVATDRIILSGMRWQKGLAPDGSHFAMQGLAPDELELADEDGVVLRAFQGYSGWSAGQLERELEDHAWLVLEPEQALLEAMPDARSWKRALKNFGPTYVIRAEMSDRPHLN